MKRHTLALLFLSLSISPAFAAVKAGVEASDQLSVEGKTLKLNGLGVREATIFHVDVYVAGLWLERPTHDAGEILSKDSDLKLIQLNFVHRVTASQMNDAWDESLKNGCGS